MLNVDDTTLKIPADHANNFLDAETSSVALGISTFQQHTFVDKRAQNKTQIKSKFKGIATSGEHNPKCGVKVQFRSSMKQGDPFLPSIFPDENPIADYTARNSRKKPLDCKCKGFGYNLSPSALLPEEMRQQWGVGMLCKPTLPRSGIISTINNSSALDESKRTQANGTRNNCGCTSNSCYVMKCKNCMIEPCLCCDIYTKHDSFRIPESRNTWKPKLSTKGSSVKCKENKNPGSLFTGSKNSSSLLKKVAYCNGKDVSNIISTSNFQRKNTSSLSLNGHSSAVTELNGYKYGVLGSQISSGLTYQNINNSMMCNLKKQSIAVREDTVTNSGEMYYQQQSQQLITDLPSSSVLSSNSLSMPDGTFEAKAVVPGSTTQIFMLGDQECVCDSCQGGLNLMTRMEKLGFSTSNVQDILSPFMLAASQRYQASTFRSALSTYGRYTPYTVPSYGNPHLSGDFYHSSEKYQCSSPSFFEYNDLSTYNCQPLASKLPSVTHEVNKSDTDSDSFVTSTFSSGFVEDITDLSVKDTVDFFVTMRSPFNNSLPTSSLSDKNSRVSSFHFSEQSTSPSFYSNEFNSRSTVMDTASYSMPYIQQEGIYGECTHLRFDDADGLTQPLSILHPSLANDFEDELQRAIENLPSS